jgi:HEAT repeat protein
MAHIFITYHHADAELAFAAQQQLEAAGFAVWINPLPEAGTICAPWIDDGLRGAFALVAILSPAARAAEVITYEWSFALGAGITVIPVIAAAIDVDLHPRLMEMDALDFAEAPRWDDLLARVYERADDLSRAVISIPELYAHSPAERIAAVKMASGPALIAAVKHPIYADVRQAAAERLGEIGGDEALAALLVTLCDADDAVSRAAALALAKFGDDAVPGLAAVMRGDSRMGKRTAVWVLSMIGTPATVPALIEALAMPGWFAPRSAAVTLGRLRDPRAVPALMAALDSEDEALVKHAQEALAAMGDLTP